MQPTQHQPQPSFGQQAPSQPVQDFYQSNQSSREFGRDISNTHQNNIKQQYPQSKERLEAIANIYHNLKDNRIPQPSIINSATGNIHNSKQNQENDPEYQTRQPGMSLNHSKSAIEPQVIVTAKTPTNNSSTTRGLKNPRIIEKKYIGN